MYMQFKHGFVEVDRWDGSPFAEPLHQAAINSACQERGAWFATMIIRSREKSTIQWVSQMIARHPVIFNIPTWDYAYRCYVSEDEWSQVMIRIAHDVDYRNFKDWTKNNASLVQSKLAHDIWEVAHKRMVSK